MKYRKLRIAWSVGWGVVSVLLLVLWVRSYRVTDVLSRGSRINSTDTVTRIGTVPGRLIWYSITEPNLATSYGWSHITTIPTPDAQQFEYANDNGILLLRFPMWLPLLFASVSGSLPWLPIRFSLRTLLIATTLVAVVLGLIVWLSR